MKTSKKTLALLFGLCSVMWSIKAVVEGLDKLFVEHPVQFGMDVLCAVLWIFCFVFALIKLRQDKAE